MRYRVPHHELLAREGQVIALTGLCKLTKQNKTNGTCIWEGIVLVVIGEALKEEWT